jgi:hypothetical protein
MCLASFSATVQVSPFHNQVMGMHALTRVGGLRVEPKVCSNEWIFPSLLPNRGL